jgi:hypothetical protein
MAEGTKREAALGFDGKVRRMTASATVARLRSCWHVPVPRCSSSISTASGPGAPWR